MLNYLIGGSLVFIFAYALCHWFILFVHKRGKEEGRNKTLLEIHELHDKTVTQHAKKLDKSLSDLANLRSRINKLPKGNPDAPKIPKTKKA